MCIRDRPKYLIADFIVEIEPKFDYLKKLCEPFLYEGERSADFSAIPSASYLNLSLIHILYLTFGRLDVEFPRGWKSTVWLICMILHIWMSEFSIGSLV